MSMKIVAEKSCWRKVGQVASGNTIAADTFIKRSTTGWVAAGNGDKPEAIAIEGGTTLTDFVYSDEEGMVVEVEASGSALAVGAVAYLASASKVDSGSQGDYSVGIVDYWDSPKTGYNRVTVSFVRCLVAAHA